MRGAAPDGTRTSMEARRHPRDPRAKYDISRDEKRARFKGRQIRERQDTERDPNAPATPRDPGAPATPKPSWGTGRSGGAGDTKTLAPEKGGPGAGGPGRSSGEGGQRPWKPKPRGWRKPEGSGGSDPWPRGRSDSGERPKSAMAAVGLAVSPAEASGRFSSGRTLAAASRAGARLGIWR